MNVEKKATKVIKNKGNGTGRADRICSDVLGDLTTLYRLADIWENEAEAIHLAAAYKLLEYVEGEDYDSKESAAFRKGLLSIGEFLEDCYKEKQNIEAEKFLKESENSES